ncbi:MAG: SusC/RagA family TonB-linked outer membrane protein [Gemmatimonadaceae bacterium]|nr:SusC/RagA family TonB-linked outer membrane protein [Gemmatimonadaceae bacterium]
MHRLGSHRTLRALLLLAAMFLGSGAVAAQQALITGKVTAGGTPLGGATITIPSMAGVGTISDESGNYRLAVSSRLETVVVLARAIGFKPLRVTVTMTNNRGEANFALEKDVLNLEQVVVTGQNQEISLKKVAFSVGVVDNAQLKEAPSVTPLGGLNGRVAGASVTSVSGAPGSAPAIRLRGATSLTGRQDPLIIVDGTITRISLADIAAEDIERVEVIKGAAASSLYGSDAANGVVQIFTKRGASLAEGQTSVTVRNEFGSNSIRRSIPNNLSHAFEVDGSGNFVLDGGGNRVTKADNISDNSYPETFDQLGQIYSPGMFFTNYISVGQRRGKTNLNASFQNTKDEGILNLLGGFSRQNFRLNADVALTEKLDLQTGAFFARSTADQPDEGNVFFGLRMLEPNIDLTRDGAEGQPYDPRVRQTGRTGNVSNPLYSAYYQQNDNERDRFTGSFRARYRMLDWLTIEGNANYDRGNDLTKNFVPVGFLNSQGNSGSGSLFQAQSIVRQYNLGSSVSATRSFGAITNTTKVAWVYEDQQNRRLSIFAPALALPRVPEFSAAKRDANNPLSPGSNTEDIRNNNVFAISTFEFQEKLIVDGLVRRDQSSLFGSEERTAYYHRASVAYRLSEDVAIRGIDEFKLRASVGTAGLRPVYDAQYEQFALVAGIPEKVTLGNPLLKPAYSREAEIGFNLNFLENFTFEYSFSDKRTTDQILNVPVSAATGFVSQWTNAGTLRGRSHEFLFGAVLAQTNNFFWRANVAFDRTRQKVEALNVAPFLVGPDEGDANTRIFRIAEGETFGVLYGSRWIRTRQQLETTIAGGTIGGTVADYTRNEEGFYVPTADWRTPDELPIKATDADGNTLTQIGDVNPDFNLSFNTQATWKGLSVTAVVNWVKGGNIYNYTRQWPFFDLRDPAFDQRGKPQEEKKTIDYYSAFYNNFDPSDYFVEDGSYLRLRELAINYEFPRTLIERLPGGMGAGRTVRLGLVGRNLFTSTKYSGYDPDVSGPGGGNPFGYRVDYFTYPVFKTFTAMLEIGF